MKVKNEFFWEKQMFQIFTNFPTLITSNQSLPWPKKVFASENLSCSADDFIGGSIN